MGFTKGGLIRECPCSCVIFKDSVAYKIDYCPLHKSAPDLYEACKSLINSYIFHCPEASEHSNAIKRGRQAIAKVKEE